MALVLFMQKVPTLEERSFLSTGSANTPPVIRSLSFEMGFLPRLTFKIAQRASTLSFLILLPESSTQSKDSFLARLSYPVRKSTSVELMLLYLTSSNLRDLEAARAGASLLNAQLVILLFEMLSLSNLGLTSIKDASLSSQSSYWLSPKLLYQMMSCRREEFLVKAQKISLNPQAEISLLLISSTSTLRCSAMKRASSFAPQSPMKRSLKTTLALSRKASSCDASDIVQINKNNVISESLMLRAEGILMVF